MAIVQRVPTTRDVVAKAQASSPSDDRPWLVTCTKLSIAGSLTCMLLTLGSCYALWVHEGCLGFLPAISDFGLPIGWPMRGVFCVGFGITAMLLASATVGVGMVRNELLGSPTVSHSRLLDDTAVTTMSGLLCASGVGMLGLFAWHDAFIGHAATTFMAFGGGLGFMCGNATLLRRIAKCDPDMHLVRVWLPRKLGVSAAVAASIALAKFGTSYVHITSKFTLSGPPRVDVMLHCRHGWGAGLELAWVSEWLLVGLLAASFATGWADVAALERQYAHGRSHATSRRASGNQRRR